MIHTAAALQGAQEWITVILLICALLVFGGFGIASFVRTIKHANSEKQTEKNTEEVEKTEAVSDESAAEKVTDNEAVTETVADESDPLVVSEEKSEAEE